MFVSRLKWLALFVLVVGFFGFVLFGVVSAVDRTTATQSPTCRDTDGGEDVYVKGTIYAYTPTYGNQTVVEACSDTRTMDELVCLTGDPTYAYTHKKTSCENGCRDGACIKTVVVETPKPTCRDTDGGEDIYVKGTLSVFTPAYGNQTVVEACADTRTMDELVCLTDDPTYAYTHKKTACVNGCKDGVCVREAVKVDTCNSTCQARYGVRGYCGGGLSNTTVESDYCSSDSKCYCMVTVVRYDTSAKSTILAPSNDAVLTNYPREAELQWTPITSASSYEIDVACDVCGSTRWENVSKLTSRAVYVTTPALAGDNQFRAKVRAVYPDGTYSQWSDSVYFSYKTVSQVKETTTEPVATQPVVQPAVRPTTETTIVEQATETATHATTETAVETGTETEPLEQIVEEKKILPVPRIKIKQVGRMSCGNSEGGDGLYSACVKDIIKLDNKINITVRTYRGNYAWLTVKGAKKAYYRVKLGDSVEIASKNGEDVINVTYTKKSPKFGVFLQIETAE